MMIRHQVGIFGAALLFGAVTAGVSLAQEQPTGPTGSEAASEKHDSSSKADQPTEATSIAKTHEGMQPGLLKRFLEDQQQIWTSPTKLRFSDADWLVPFSGFTAGLVVTDSDFNKSLSHNPKTINRYNNLSNASVAALVGGAGGMWLLGHANHNKHWTETGFLSGEAALNSLVLVEGMKYSFGRQRPDEGIGNGEFFKGGTSFPSEHAAAAWSVAGVVAHEYPGTFTKILAYGLASLVDISRIKAQKHFPSDVVVGTMLGNLVAQNIYSRHHDVELGGTAWRSISQTFRSDGTRSPANQGSPYVPLDSWIYPALDRLAAMGLINSGFAGMQPWTRSECARLLNEAEEKVGEQGETRPEVQNLLSTLESELRPEIEAAGGGDAGPAFRLESLYSRTEHITGKPLTDGYHFAQTQFNDFGRPYGEGWSTVAGFSSYTTSGRWVGYVRGELQTAPSIPALPLTARQFIAAADGIPSVPPASGSPSVQQFNLLEGYVGVMLDNWQVSFGKQSLDWGPGDGGSMVLSDNIEPINMFRINRVSPVRLPSFLKFLGPVRMEFFIGQLSGHHFVDTEAGVAGSWSQTLNPQPLTQGGKFSFKLSPNLEVGLTYATIFGGTGVPATLGTLVNSVLDTGGDLPGGGSKSSRFNSLDFTYRIPKLRNWLTLYGEGFAHDQLVYFIDPKARPLPFGYPERAAWRAGIYVPRFPGLAKLDFRAEGGFTDIPVPLSVEASGFYYTANRYLNGDTNNGNVVGSWMGRAGQGAQAWTNYWFNSRNRLQLNFRHQKVSQVFMPGGGTLTDVGFRGDYWVRSDLGLSTWVQYEHWLFPLIQPTPSTNVTAAVEIRFAPRKLFRTSAANTSDTSLRTGDRP